MSWFGLLIYVPAVLFWVVDLRFRREDVTQVVLNSLAPVKGNVAEIAGAVANDVESFIYRQTSLRGSLVAVTAVLATSLSATGGWRAAVGFPAAIGLVLLLWLVLKGTSTLPASGSATSGRRVVALADIAFIIVSLSADVLLRLMSSR